MAIKWKTLKDEGIGVSSTVVSVITIVLLDCDSVVKLSEDDADVNMSKNNTH